MFENFEIRSHKGTYSVTFATQLFDSLKRADLKNSHFIIDERVAKLYERELADVLNAKSVLLISANEESKSLEAFPNYISQLMANGVRRGHELVAIGGGIIQDITSFLAATLLRGLPWSFYPTTLLAQADSCIGSKSSINVAGIKNILGTFTPPTRIEICPQILKTLTDVDFRSGVGEMLKIHAIHSPESFRQIAEIYDRLFQDDSILVEYIQRSLLFKKEFVECDEFDTNERLVLNYGHTFGHAIEAATHFAIPHGIGVTIGMEMANFLSAELGFSKSEFHSSMSSVLTKNFRGHLLSTIPFQDFLDALKKDKKHSSTKLRLVLPDQMGKIRIFNLEANDAFEDLCRRFFNQEKSA